MTEARAALLCTADGGVYRGRSAGAMGVAAGEAVFNTSMSGYQEILTDPSYAGQVVVMTSPHIGNYGVNTADEQSSRPYLAGFVTRALSARPSSWRSEGAVGDYLVDNGVVAMTDVDTRRLTRHLRDRGAMPVALGVDVDETELMAIAASAPSMVGQDLASVVSVDTAYRVGATSTRLGTVVAVDLGMKRDIIGQLTGRGFDVEVVPAATPASSILDRRPDGVFLSNGPGDPEPLTATVEAVKGVLGRVPVFGICLGHQVLGLAAGATTYKLPFGHHGANHPVRRIADGRVQITSQNHGFAVDLWSLTGDAAPPRHGLVDARLLPVSVDSSFGAVRPTHQNLNDGTLEGLHFDDVQAFSVQFHPEAAPGPREAGTLFDQFVAMIVGGP